jgi:MFS family permease
VRPRLPDLLHERTFRGFWIGQTISLFGDQISLLAIPLVGVLVLHASATEMGYLIAAGLVPSLLFSLYAGAWLDRRGHRRRYMIAADLGRAAALVSLPIASWLKALTLAQLYAVAFCIGTLDVLFFVAYSSLFVSLVRRDQFISANALLNGSRAVSEVGGQSIAGALVALLSAPVALLTDATSFLASALFLGRIHPEEAPTSDRGRGTVLDGARYILHSSVIRRLLGVSATVNYFNFLFNALFVLFVVTQLGVGPAALGLVLAIGATGAVLGSIAAGPVTRRIGVGRTFLLPAPLLLVPAAPARTALTYVLLGLAEFGSGLGVMFFDITTGSIQAAVVPPELRSRVYGAYRTVNYGIRPLGAITGGLLGAVWGLRAGLWVGAIGAMSCAVWLLRSSVLSLHEISPQRPEP